jgi:hypothetical protein
MPDSSAWLPDQTSHSALTDCQGSKGAAARVSGPSWWRWLRTGAGIGRFIAVYGSIIGRLDHGAPQRV